MDEPSSKENRVARSGGAEPDPVFVVGTRRSGTTLLRLMLDHHPEIAVPHEFDFAVTEVSDDGRWPDMADYRRHLEEHSSFRRTGLTWVDGCGYPELMEHFLHEHQGGKRLAAMAVHWSFHRLLFLWPRARFIHLVRDPRDVAPSLVGLGVVGNLWSAASHWVDVERSWERLREKIADDRWYEVRYEDLVANPEEELAAICRFLGVAYAPEMLAYAADTTYSRPDPSIAYRWRRTLSPGRRRLVESVVGDALRRYRYEVPDPPPQPVGALRTQWLRTHDRLARALSRTRRLGVKLVLAHAIASRLGLEGWRRRTTRQILDAGDRIIR